MITTLLVDLDDTLLENDMGRFIPAYFQRLGAFMADIAPPERFLRILLQATQSMVDNLDPARTLKRAFADTFYPRLQTTEEALQPALQTFYAESFPSLRSLTRPRQSARDLVTAALEAGMEVVIATNPLFPRTAIEQRLSWAGLPVGEIPFALVTSYEEFHFSKPHLAYYAEILGRLGQSPHEAAMIGNDPEADLAPASALGMAVFHMSPTPADGYPGGDLSAATAWLQNAGKQADPNATARPDVALARLRAHLAALLTMTKSLSEKAWHRRPEADSWAPVEIVCHLRDVEKEVNHPRIQAILTEGDPFLSAEDTDPWAQERAYGTQCASEALDAFVQARKKTLAMLEPLSADGWSRPARHSLLGPTTLAELTTIATEHDLLHLAQLRACMRVDPKLGGAAPSVSGRGG